MAVCGSSYNTDCGGNNDCFDIIRTNKTVTVPCTRNVREAYTVNIPKQHAYTVNKNVPYIDYEQRVRQVPYNYVDRQPVTRMVPSCQVVPVTRNVCTRVPVRNRFTLFPGRRTTTKKCPRTTYIQKRSCVPRQFLQPVQRTGWKNVPEQVPVQKVRQEPVTKYVTTNVPETRYRYRQQTKYVSKTIPVYNIVPKRPKPYPPAISQQPPNYDVQHSVGNYVVPEGRNRDRLMTLNEVQFDMSDDNKDGKLSFNEYGAARMDGLLEATGTYDPSGRSNVVSDFRRIDKDNDGKLSNEEVAFDAADLNKDGTLSFNEYAAARKSGKLQALNRRF